MAPRNRRGARKVRLGLSWLVCHIRLAYDPLSLPYEHTPTVSTCSDTLIVTLIPGLIPYP